MDYFIQKDQIYSFLQGYPRGSFKKILKYALLIGINFIQNNDDQSIKKIKQLSKDNDLVKNIKNQLIDEIICNLDSPMQVGMIENLPLIQNSQKNSQKKDKLENKSQVYDKKFENKSQVYDKNYQIENKRQTSIDKKSHFENQENRKRQLSQKRSRNNSIHQQQNYNSVQSVIKSQIQQDKINFQNQKKKKQNQQDQQDIKVKPSLSKLIDQLYGSKVIQMFINQNAQFEDQSVFQMSQQQQSEFINQNAQFEDQSVFQMSQQQQNEFSQIEKVNLEYSQNSDNSKTSFENATNYDYQELMKFNQQLDESDQQIPQSYQTLQHNQFDDQQLKLDQIQNCDFKQQKEEFSDDSMSDFKLDMNNQNLKELMEFNKQFDIKNDKQNNDDNVLDDQKMQAFNEQLLTIQNQLKQFDDQNKQISLEDYFENQK